MAYKIKNAEFVKSAAKPSQMPEALPSVAFIGRSNVGKSSLINTLVNQKKLAKTSSTPGKTRLMNYFLINQKYYMIDLPGVGYAKVSKTEKDKLSKMVREFFKTAQNLRLIFHLIDIRHELTAVDKELNDILNSVDIPRDIIFTKADKLSRSKGIAMGKKIGSSIKHWYRGEHFYFSKLTGQGKEEIVDRIFRAYNSEENNPENS
jgi:GTP-binding protein